jgi:hypothetical protein
MQLASCSLQQLAVMGLHLPATGQHQQVLLLPPLLLLIPAVALM